MIHRAGAGCKPLLGAEFRIGAHAKHERVELVLDPGLDGKGHSGLRVPNPCTSSCRKSSARIFATRRNSLVVGKKRSMN